LKRSWQVSPPIAYRVPEAKAGIPNFDWPVFLVASRLAPEE
jgi:hypothetical protein